MKKLLFPMVAVIASFNTANAQTAPRNVVSCGASSGYSYFHESALITEEDAGWSEDQLSEGYFIVQFDGEEFDLLFRDVAGLRSATDQGAVVISNYTGEGKLGLIVVYADGGVSETYNFQNLGTAEAEVTWTQVKVDDLFSKSGTYYAKCSEE